MVAALLFRLDQPLDATDGIHHTVELDLNPRQAVGLRRRRIGALLEIIDALGNRRGPPECAAGLDKHSEQQGDRNPLIEVPARIGFHIVITRWRG